MKNYLILLIPCFALTGCVGAGYMRLIPENKSAHIEVVTIYGHVTIDTRVVGDTNNAALVPLKTPQ